VFADVKDVVIDTGQIGTGLFDLHVKGWNVGRSDTMELFNFGPENESKQRHTNYPDYDMCLNV
jgi:hypothetical protein